MPFFLATLVIQVALVVHVLRTGRSMYWAFIIFFLPAVGAIAYVIVELLPEWSNSYQARKAFRGVKRALDTDGDLRRRQQQHKLSGSIEATRQLARELTGRGLYAEAIEHYEAALTGLYEHDPDLLLGLAEAQFASREYDEAKATLELLKQENPDYRSPDGHLLYARSLEESGDIEAAEGAYESVIGYFAGAEARLRYARLLEREGQTGDALEQYEDIVASAELAPRHYRQAQKQWVAEAKEAVRRLKG
jgi:hypothetical protein